MILSYCCCFGQPLDISLAVRLGGRVEIDALEFVNALPVDWRLTDTTGAPLTEWLPGNSRRRKSSVHDLQFYRDGKTRGISAAGLVLETRGIGEARVLVWPRIGTFSDGTGGCHSE